MSVSIGKQSLAAKTNTIQYLAKQAILARKTDDEALAIVQSAFPGAETTIGSIRSYRSRLRAERDDVPLNREIEKKRVSVETTAPQDDTALIHRILDVLRGSDKLKAEALRSAITAALARETPKSALDIFGSDLPDEAFEGVFDQPRQSGWREVDV